MEFIVALFFIIVITSILRHPVVRGAIGEFIVRLIIGKTTEKIGKEKFVINNLLIEDNNNRTAQIDHIVINSNGVFIIETKNYSGRIYGKDTQKEWTQVLNYGKVKNHFYSPVKQNLVHAYRIKELMPDDTPINPIVVFVKGNISYIQSEYVYSLFDLIKKLKMQSAVQLPLEEQKNIYKILLSHNQNCTDKSREHIEMIKRNQRDISNHICPRCKGTLVLRKGKNGDFLGCSNYPKCRFTKKS